MQSIWVIVQFIFVFGLLVFIHELGHFLAAKWLGIGVEEFGFGYPPRLAKLFTWKGTIVSLNWIPFGGFVRLKGETDDGEEGGLLAAPKWKRFLILIAGATMNFILGIILLIIMTSAAGEVDTTRVLITEVAASSPAQAANLQAGDIITYINEVPINSMDDLSAQIDANLGSEIELTFLRGEEVIVTHLTPRDNPPEGQGAMGIIMGNPYTAIPFSEAVGSAFSTFWMQVKTTLMLPVNLIRGAINPEDARLVGIKGIYDIFSSAAALDQTTAVTATTSLPIFRLAVVSMVSIALGITNLLPIPALDGGQILFLFIETITRKKIPDGVANTINSVFFVMLILLMVFITVQDFINPVLAP